MHPVFGEFLVDAMGLAPRGEQPQPEPVILPPRQIRHLHPAEMRGVVDRRQAADHIALQERAMGDARRHADPAERPAGGVDAPVGGEGEDRPRRLHVADLAGELLGAPAVVGVEKGDEAAARRGDRGVARRRRPAVGVPEDRAQAPVRIRERADMRTAGVGRAVVDEDHLPGAHGLRLHRGDGLRQRPCRVMDRGDHRDRRRVAHCSIRKLACRRMSQAPTTKSPSETPST